MRKANRYKIHIEGLDERELQLLDMYVIALSGEHHDGQGNYDNLNTREYNVLKRYLKLLNPKATMNAEKRTVEVYDMSTF